ncbi:MFS transporter [bacterium]|nr:MAG: MFS transporter [bacterium]
MLKYKTFLQVFTKGALFSVIFLLISITFTPKAQAGPNSPSDFLDNSGTECAWVADSLMTCGGEEFWFDYDLSISKGRAIYHWRKDGAWKSAYLVFTEDGEDGMLVNNPDTDSGGTEAFISDRQKRKWRQHARDNNPNNPDNTDGVTVAYDGETNPNNSAEHFMCGIGSRSGHQCWSGRGGVYNTISEEGAAKLAEWREKIDETVASEEECTEDAGSLGFVLCPILDTTRNAVQALIGDGTGKGFLVELLTIRPLSTTNTPELYNGWQVIRNIALGLYILVFVLIIFGNGVGYDPYTIKRALPRLAAGVVLTFASWWILQTLVDLSNLVGNVVPSLVAQMSQNAGVANYAIDLNPATAFQSIILLIVVAFIALGALLVGIAGLIMRMVIIYGLVLLAPLAFLTWVLPNTESVFKKWWKNLIKVLMMFPIVTGMLSLSLFFQQVMMNTQRSGAGDANGIGGSAANSVTGIVGMLAPLIAIIMIPKTFKWGGEAFAAAAGYMAAKATQGKDWGKKSALESSKSGRVGQALNTASKVPVLGRVPGIGGITNRQKAATVAKRQASFDKRMSDGLDKVSDNNLIKLHKTQRKRDGTLKSSPYAKAVDAELKSRAGKARSNAAENYRNGQFEDAGRAATKLHKINAALGISPANTESTLSTMYDRIDRSTGGSPSPDSVTTAMGEPPASSQSAAYRVGAAVGSAQRRWSQRNQGGYVDPSAWGSTGTGPTSGGGSPQPSSSGPGSLPPTPAPGPRPAPPPPPSGGAPAYSTPAGAPRYTTSGTPIPPPPSGHTPIWNGPSAPPPPPSGNQPIYNTPTTPPPPPPSGGNTTPPPYRGPAPAWQPAPRQSPPPAPGPGAPPPPSSSSGSSGPASSGGGTVINNVTNNNSTTNSTTNNNSVKTVLNSNGVPSSIALGTASQLGNIKKRFGEGSAEHSGLAGIESKLNDLGRMIQSGSLSQTRLRDNVRDIHRDIDSLPPGAHDQQDNLRGVLDNIERNATDDGA